MNWAGCTLGGATLIGGWTETWSTSVCPSGSPPTALTNGSAVTRVSTGQTLTLSGGATITTTTNTHTTWDGTSIPNTGITTSMASGVRTVVINGLHKTMNGPLGRLWFDHSLQSLAGLSVSGTRAGANRVITGNLTLWHNLLQYKAVHTFNSVTWGTAACCYPTSGSITSVLTGTGRAGNVSLTFSATCGQATFVDTNAASSTINLTQCN